MVQRGTALAALFGRGLAEVAQQGGEAAVAAERGDAHRVPGAQIGGGGQGGLGFALQVGEIVGHGGTLHAPPIPSWPGLTRPSTSYVRPKTWVAGPSPAMDAKALACTFLTISANDAASS